jgi:hypothetical protein
MNGNRRAELDGKAPVPGDMVGVRVSLEHAFDAHARLCGCREQRLDFEGRVDDDCDPGGIVTDEVRRTAQILVHELLKEQHGR